MSLTGACILVIDDEPQIHRFLGPALMAAGYTVEHAHQAAEGLRLAATRAPAAVLLDLGLPDIDGQEVLRRLRAFSEVPVIVLSARDREADKIIALDGGADDYVEKPFGVGELLARIRTALRHRRTQDGVAEVIELPSLTIDFPRRQARLADNAPLTLSRREWDLLALLARNPRPRADPPPDADRRVGPGACGGRAIPARLYRPAPPEAGRGRHADRHRTRRRLPHGGGRRCAAAAAGTVIESRAAARYM